MKHAALVVAMLLAVSVDAVAQTPVVNAVLSQATLTAPVAPGMPVVVNGAYLAGGASDCPGPKVPLTCGSVSATVNGRAVPVRMVAPSQVITYIPSDFAPGQASIVVKNHQGVTSNALPVQVDAFSPGIQRLFDSGVSMGYFSDSSRRPITRMNPAVPGQELTLYAVGLGPTSPMVATGEMGPAAATTLPVLFAGSRAIPVLSSSLGCGALCDPGIYLVKFALPPDTLTGDVQVRLEIAGKRSNSEILVVGPPVSTPAVGYLQSFFDAKVRTMSPGAAANVVGGGFASMTGGGGPCLTDPGVWPVKCQGVTVTVNGKPAAIQLVTPSFITIQIPFELTPGPASLTVERTADSQVLRSAPFSFTLDAVSPTLPSNPQSPYAGVVIANSGGVVSRTNPLLPGDDIFVYATGLGQTNPPLTTGFALIQPAQTVLTPTVTVGGKPLTGVVAEVLPGMIGQYRISAKVPAGLGVGDLPIMVEIGGKKSQDGLLVPAANAPVIAAVANAASGVTDIVSGSWVSIWGRNLSATRRDWREVDIIYDWLPVSLDGVEVTINNTAAVVAYVSPLQLNVLAPDNLPLGPVEVTVKSSLGWQRSTANVKPFAPGLFQLGLPPGIYVMALHSDWAYVARPEILPPSISARPARPGETIVFYGTGFGKTDPAVPFRQRFNGAAPLAGGTTVRLQIGNAQAEVLYVGLVGNGLYQINAVVPDVPDGDQEVIVSMGGESSARGRYIAIKR